MVAGCSNRTLKFLFCSTNLFICLAGALLFGFSLWANLDENLVIRLAKAKGISYEDFDLFAAYRVPLWIMVVVGALMFLVGFFGCCGAVFESNTVLSLYFVIVLIMTILQIGVAIYLFAAKDKVEHFLYKRLAKFGNADDEHLKDLKPIQDAFQCCGATPETRNRFVEHGLCEGHLKNQLDCFTVLSYHLNPSNKTLIISGIILLAVMTVALASTNKLRNAFRAERN